MANKVEIIVVAKDETKPTFDKVKAEGKKAGEEAGKGIGDGISKGMADVKANIEKNGLAPISSLIAAQQKQTKASEKASEAIKKYGADSAEAADASLNLVKANISVESSARKAAAAFGEMTPELHKALDDIGLAGPQIDNLGKSLESGFKKLATVATTSGEDAGKGFSQGLIQSSSTEIGSLGPVLAPVIAVAATFLGGVLVAGITAAVGGGALAAGIALAVRDPAISSAFGEIGTMMLHSIQESAAAFKQPLLDILPGIRQAWSGIGSDIGDIFAKASTWIAPAAEALESFTKNVVAGLQDVTNNADPVMAALFDGITQVGQALGDFLTEMSDHGPEAAVAMGDAFTALSATITATGETLGFLSDSYVFIRDAADEGIFQKLTDEIMGYETEAGNATTVTEGIGAAFDLTKSSIEATREEMQRMSDDLKAATDPMFALIKAQELARTTQDAYNTAVKEHGKNSEEARAASVKLAEAAVDLAAKSAEASGSFNGQLTPAMRAALTAAGATKTEIDAVAQAVGTAHSKLTEYEGTYTAHVVTIFEQIGKPSSETSLGSQTFKGLRTGGTIGAAMSGGIQGNLTLVGEDGPELVSLPYGSSVKTAGMTNQALEEALDPHRQKPGTGNDDTWNALLMEIRMLRNEVSKSSGGNVYLDNRLVGSIQGRQADLYERAG